MKLTMKLLALLFGMLILASIANAESPREQLNQMVEQLQKSPNDNALREQIIRLVQTIKPAPAMPDEAERRMARGTEAFKEAKSTADYQAAVKEFQQATLAAPWSGDAYFNLGLSQDKAEDYEGSLRSLKLAQLASPDSKDIKDLYYKVEYQRDKFAEQNSAEARRAAEQQRITAQKAEIYRGLNGGVWRYEIGYGSMGADDPWSKVFDRSIRTHDVDEYIEIQGHVLRQYVTPGGFDMVKTTFESRQFEVEPKLLVFAKVEYYKITISGDGQSITIDCSRDRTVKEQKIFKRIK